MVSPDRTEARTAPELADPPRPRRADVAGSYDLGATAYEALWSPVILPPVIALVTSLPLTSRPELMSTYLSIIEKRIATLA